jgi:hypothetical protein
MDEQSARDRLHQREGWKLRGPNPETVSLMHLASQEMVCENLAWDVP